MRCRSRGEREAVARAGVPAAMNLRDSPRPPTSCRPCLARARSVALTAAVACSGAPALAADLAVSVETGGAADGRTVAVRIEWRHAWRDARNHDGVWVVVRDRERPATPIAKLLPGGARSLGGGTHDAEIAVTADGVGAFVAPRLTPGEERVDPVVLRVELRLAGDSVPTSPFATGLEMVYIPAGAFELGDADAQARAQGSLFAVDEDPGAPTRYEVRDESAIAVADEPGALWYEVGGEPQYRGDRAGPIPEGFPKGTRAFWIMKREFRQGDWAAFLAALPPVARALRWRPPAASAEGAACFSLADVDGVPVASAPARPLQFVSWDDTCALLDWHRLRPLTELEFEKAARGPVAPCALDFPWGIADAAPVLRRVESTRDLRHDGAAAEAGGDAAARIARGASYFGVLDLAGSVWERVVAAGRR